MESTNKSAQTNRGKSQPCLPFLSSTSFFPYVVYLSMPLWPSLALSHHSNTFLLNMSYLFVCMHFETILILDSCSVLFLLVSLYWSLISLSCTSWFKILSYPPIFYNENNFSLTIFFLSFHTPFLYLTTSIYLS